jgi:hypothetical protein
MTYNTDQVGVHSWDKWKDAWNKLMKEWEEWIKNNSNKTKEEWEKKWNELLKKYGFKK